MTVVAALLAGLTPLVVKMPGIKTELIIVLAIMIYFGVCMAIQ